MEAISPSALPKAGSMDSASRCQKFADEDDEIVQTICHTFIKSLSGYLEGEKLGKELGSLEVLRICPADIPRRTWVEG